MTDDIKNIRKTLHEHPQPSGNESFAHDLIVGELRKLHPDNIYPHVGGYGVIAAWNGVTAGEKPFIPTAPKKTAMAFRADTDALPIGHRCGHDGHTAILLRLAQLIDASRDKLPHTVLLCFQPEEETGHGAAKIIDSGILQQYDIQAFFGFHNIPGYNLGDILLRHGAFTAASTGISLHLDGEETHASTPERGRNPGIAVAEIISQANTLSSPVATMADTKSFVLATLVGAAIGGENYGIAAGNADIYYTLRSFDNDALDRLIADVESLAANAADRHGLTLSTALHDTFRATINTPWAVDLLASAAADGKMAKQQLDLPFRWSEDFAEYLLRWPGAFFGVGAGVEHPVLHNPKYEFPDSIIEPTAQYLLAVALSSYYF